MKDIKPENLINNPFISLKHKGFRYYWIKWADIEKIINVPGIRIEICGTWIWVGGETKPVHEFLKACDYKYAPKKQKWYYAGVKSNNRYGHWSMDEIRSHYGSKTIRIETDETKQYAQVGG